MARINGLFFVFLLTLHFFPFRTAPLYAQTNPVTKPAADVSAADKRAAEERQLALAESFLKAEKWDKAIDAFIAAAAATNSNIAAAARNGLLQALTAKKVADDQDAADAATRKLELGRAFLKAGDWDKAVEALVDAAAAEDTVIAKSARDDLQEAVLEKEAAPLGVRAYLWPPFNRWWPIDYVVYIAGFILLLVLLGLIWRGLAGPLIEYVFAYFLKRTNDWKVSVAGGAKEELRNSVFDEFVITMRELRRYRDGDSGLSAVGWSNARFFTPLSLEDLVGPDLKVQGIDVTRVAAIMQTVRDYYSYQFELRVDTIEEHAYVYALLRWGGRTEKIWQVPVLADDTKFGYREIGRHLAFVVYGDSLVRT
ncbi:MULTISPECIES: hypothetical protein [Sinorhizobium]|uniref:hypothetical protein n=1 Tax=Sinorhizobium TaxID=28105 RepID=UPI0011A6E49F|nr:MULTISPECIES: hypothetical protein [Sinorhizobium]MDW9439249.1 hypothetical protein [Sinorhizobium meliloti]MDW9484072.1 hypothetical protein [Sinorhizobium meliloti]MDX0523525.1 hypothetical protein [Sinorhizobium medicae]MDX0634248.1 hypothetical protein [Sinorhizobium medicae]MQV61388.1 hypothetical protein [Sinorhizobium meliloti]